MIVERYLTAPYVSLTTILFDWLLGHQLTGAMSHFFIFPLLKGTFHWCWTMKPCQGIKFSPPIYMLTLIIITDSASHSSEYFLLKLKYAKESVGPHWKNTSVMWAILDKYYYVHSFLFVAYLADFLKAHFTLTLMMKDGKWFVLEILRWGLVRSH